MQLRLSMQGESVKVFNQQSKLSGQEAGVLGFVKLSKMQVIYLIYGLNLLIGAAVFFLDYTNKFSAAKLSSYVGILFLAPTLLPTNVTRFKLGPVSRWINPLLKTFLVYRKHTGILAGVWFIVHASLSWGKFLNLSFFSIFNREIILGTVGLLIFGMLLATSNRWSMRKMKRSWKNLQTLVWFVIPVGFVHALLASIKYTNEWSKPAILGFGGLLAFVAMEFLILFVQGSKSKWRHVAYVSAGAVAGLLTLAIYYL